MTSCKNCQRSLRNDFAFIDGVYQRVIDWLSVDNGGITCINWYRRHQEFRRPDGQQLTSVGERDEQHGLVEIIDIQIDGKPSTELHLTIVDGEEINCMQLVSNIKATLKLEVFRESGEKERGFQDQTTINIDGVNFQGSAEDVLMDVTALVSLPEYVKPWAINGREQGDARPILTIKRGDNLINDPDTDEIREQVYESYASRIFDIEYCRKFSRLISDDQLVYCATYCNQSVLCVEPPNECE